MTRKLHCLVLPVALIVLLPVLAHSQVKISSLPETTTPSSSDVLPIVSGGITKKVTVANLLGVGPSGTVTTSGSPANGNLTKFSGTNSITNGDLSGDVTTAGGLATAIANNVVTYAKMQDISAGSRLLGRGDSGAGDPEEITIGSGLSMTGTTLSATGGGTVTTTGSPASGNLTKFSGSNSITNANLTGDVTTSDGLATTISNDAVTYAKMQNISAASKLLGRGDSGAGDPQEITIGSGLSISGTTLSATSGSGATANSTTGSVPYLSATNTFSDTPLFREDANTLAQRNSTTSQTTNIYQTFTDASNYSRLAVFNTGTGSFQIATQAAGTGTLQRLDIRIGGSQPAYVFQNNNFSPATDAGHSLGTSSIRWNGVFSTGFVNGASNGYQWSGRAGIYSESASIIRITDASGGDSSITLRFGGTASNSPALRRSSANLEAVVADASAYTAMVALKHCYSGTNVCDFAGSGSPEGVVTGSVGSTYRRTDGGAGTSFYVKESGSGNTGWVAK